MYSLKQKYFYGGVHPGEEKLSGKSAIQVAPLLASYTVPLQQHIGAPAKPLVQKGDKVLQGQLIAEATGFVSANIHAPTSGTVQDICPVRGPMGNLLSAIKIISDGEDLACPPLPSLDPLKGNPTYLRKRVGDAGIVGMGGAAFPTLVKLSPTKDVDTLILNGVECEPYLTADHRLMLERNKLILDGAQASATILGVKKIILAVEANKADAVQQIHEEASRRGIETTMLKVRYPQGAEKQLIYATTGRTVPAGGLPMDVGCVVQNVGTAAAIGEAVVRGKPCYERIVTLTGSAIVHPSNWQLRIGTSYQDAITLAGGIKEEVAQIISGGPMMGFTVYSMDIPVMKNTSGIVLLSERETYQVESHACIRCGQCNDICPMIMQPGILGVQIEHGRYDLAEEWHVTDCLECGCCSFVCPAHRPLVQFMRRAKAEVIAKRKATTAKK